MILHVGILKKRHISGTTISVALSYEISISTTMSAIIGFAKCVGVVVAGFALLSIVTPSETTVAQTKKVGTQVAFTKATAENYQASLKSIKLKKSVDTGKDA